jgi:hypothetical protein
MQPLVIKVEDVDSGKVWVYVRDESPVLLGRHVAATLRIGHVFLSTAHGTFAYDEARACWTYADLASWTGSALGDRRLAPQEVVPVPPSSVLHVGRLALTILADAPADRPASDDASPFAIGATDPQTETMRLPVRVEAEPEAPPSLAGGTMLLPAPLLESAAPPRPREAPAVGTTPRLPPRGRAARIAAVALGATLASGLVTWIVVRPAAPPRAPDVARAAEPEPPAEPPFRRTYVQPEPPRPRDEPPAQAESPPRPKRRPVPPAGRVRRGANGAFVLE